MVRTGFPCALVAVLALAQIVAGDICSDAKTCAITGLGRTCDRTTNRNCPPCLAQDGDTYTCYPLRTGGVCAPETTLCAADTLPSGSGSGSGTPVPTTTQPPSDSGSNSEGSGSTTPAPTTRTPRPTTTRPATTAPATKTPKPSASANVTEAPEETPEPVENNTSNESGSNLPLIVGIIGAVVVAVAVIVFLIWKRNTDDDDDSDDDDFRFKNPPPTYNARAAGLAPTYNNSNASRAVTSPVGRGGTYGRPGVAAPYGAPRYGAAARAGAQPGGARYNGATEYSSGGMYGAQYGANTDYGSPTHVNGPDQALYTGPGGAALGDRDSLADSLSGGEDGRDGWGTGVAATNTQGQAKQPRPVPTSRNVEAIQRDNRTHSTVSIEF